MVKINLSYKGGLRCSATHAPSGNVITTDAPVDNNGKGEAFSPTDLVATALGACMATVMGIVAERKEISLEGMAVEVRKFMSEDSPRRISKLEVDIKMPLPASHPERKLLESAARGCPVHHSLHPEIETVFNWTWA
ncbi:MAG: OsmC family protein [Akkermansiaceae bacterium]|nr:OsmC family protein [Akkermansiaceae bacterium]MDP4721880.1 OsmC family protein [Akkermansiaceae bacterium]MDP4778661.1 OsmC family protein [Akkermansiaceae bacterium]MDP4847794.1 OsmC family protein [Akkermansiaceae bacterium]MDP4897402.1 OsmC family protein [Akkermansiaceae bacterium]